MAGKSDDNQVCAIRGVRRARGAHRLVRDLPGIYRLGFCRVWIGADELGVVISRVGADVAPAKSSRRRGSAACGARSSARGATSSIRSTSGSRNTHYRTWGRGASRASRTASRSRGRRRRSAWSSLSLGIRSRRGVLANPGQKGIKESPHPGVYRINPTRRGSRTTPPRSSTPDMWSHNPQIGEPTQLDFASNTQRGVIRDPLPAGLYYLNPYEFQVARVKVGYRELSFAAEHAITFPASDGHTIRLEATIVSGSPSRRRAAHREANPATRTRWSTTRSARRSSRRCGWWGADSPRARSWRGRRASDSRRSSFANYPSSWRRSTCGSWPALVRDVDVPEVVRRPIQSSRIANEEAETNRVKTETAKISTELNEIKGALVVEAARVHAETEKLAQGGGRARQRRARAAARRDEVTDRGAPLRGGEAQGRHAEGPGPGRGRLRIIAIARRVRRAAEPDRPFRRSQRLWIVAFRGRAPRHASDPAPRRRSQNPQSDLIEALRAIAGALAKPK